MPASGWGDLSMKMQEMIKVLGENAKVYGTLALYKN